jgi:hypothetical protein
MSFGSVPALWASRAAQPLSLGSFLISTRHQKYAWPANSIKIKTALALLLFVSIALAMRATRTAKPELVSQGIILLDDKDRIYLSGAETCGSKGCFQISSGNDVGHWIIWDMAHAKTVDGRIGSVDFSLQPAQLKAVRDFVSRRHLSYIWNLLPGGSYQGETARDSAESLAKLLRTESSFQGTGVPGQPVSVELNSSTHPTYVFIWSTAFTVWMISASIRAR